MTVQPTTATRYKFRPWWASLTQDVRSILLDVCLGSSVTVWELQSTLKTARIVQAREEVWRIMRSKGYSLPQCGRALQKHHTTVLAAVRRDPHRHDKAEATP